MYTAEHTTVLVHDARLAYRLMRSNYRKEVREYTLALEQDQESLWEQYEYEVALYEHAPGILDRDGDVRHVRDHDDSGGYSFRIW
jgi:hypothetical protein